MVTRDVNGLKLKDQCTEEEERSGELIPIYEDGFIIRKTSLSDIRDLINKQLNLHTL